MITKIILSSHYFIIDIIFEQYRITGKFGRLAVYITTAKLKSAKISY